MRVKVIENTGDVPPVLAAIQAEFINQCITKRELSTLIDRGNFLNWNLFELVDEKKGE